GQLEPAEAIPLTGKMAKAISDTRYPVALPHQTLALASSLEPKKARNLAYRLLMNGDQILSNHLNSNMNNSIDPYVLSSHALALAAVAGRLEQRDAVYFTGPAAEGTLLIMSMTSNPSEVSELAGALSTLVSWVKPEEAADRAIIVVRAVGEELTPLL